MDEEEYTPTDTGGRMRRCRRVMRDPAPLEHHYRSSRPFSNDVSSSSGLLTASKNPGSSVNKARVFPWQEPRFTAMLAAEEEEAEWEAARVIRRKRSLFPKHDKTAWSFSEPSTLSMVPPFIIHEATMPTGQECTFSKTYISERQVAPTILCRLSKVGSVHPTMADTFPSSPRPSSNPFNPHPTSANAFRFSIDSGISNSRETFDENIKRRFSSRLANQIGDSHVIDDGQSPLDASVLNSLFVPLGERHQPREENAKFKVGHADVSGMDDYSSTNRSPENLKIGKRGAIVLPGDDLEIYSTSSLPPSLQPIPSIEFDEQENLSDVPIERGGREVVRKRKINWTFDDAPEFVERLSSEATTCTLRNETSTRSFSPISQPLSGPVPLVLYVPSPKHSKNKSMARIYNEDSDISDFQASKDAQPLSAPVPLVLHLPSPEDEKKKMYNSETDDEADDAPVFKLWSRCGTLRRNNACQWFSVPAAARKRKLTDDEDSDGSSVSNEETSPIEQIPTPSPRPTRDSISPSVISGSTSDSEEEITNFSRSNAKRRKVNRVPDSPSDSESTSSLDLTSDGRVRIPSSYATTFSLEPPTSGQRQPSVISDLRRGPRSSSPDVPFGSDKKPKTTSHFGPIHDLVQKRHFRSETSASGDLIRNQEFSCFDEFKALPDRNLSKMLQSRFVRSSPNAPKHTTVNFDEIMGNNLALLAAREAPAVGEPMLDDRFQRALNTAFETWMTQHGQKIIEDAIQKAVAKTMGDKVFRMAGNGLEKGVKKEMRYEDKSEIEESQEDGSVGFTPGESEDEDWVRGGERKGGGGSIGLGVGWGFCKER